MLLVFNSTLADDSKINFAVHGTFVDWSPIKIDSDEIRLLPSFSQRIRKFAHSPLAFLAQKPDAHNPLLSVFVTTIQSRSIKHFGFFTAFFHPLTIFTALRPNMPQYLKAADCGPFKLPSLQSLSSTPKRRTQFQLSN
jgi:hypothetical protein